MHFKQTLSLIVNIPDIFETMFTLYGIDIVLYSISTLSINHRALDIPFQHASFFGRFAVTLSRTVDAACLSFTDVII